jgi:hypothetical protein
MTLREGGGATRKILVGSILKHSPRCYAFLQFLFHLPSRKTLQSLLNTVQFRTGINAHVFSILKGNVQCLIKIALVVSHLTRCQSESICISIRRTEGFEDLGSHGRTSNIANRALVFKLRGLANHLNMRSGVNIVVVQ